MRWYCCFLSLLGCKSSLSVDSGPDPIPGDSPGIDSQPTDSDTEDSEGPEHVPGTSAAIFDDTVLHTIEITLSEDALLALKQDPYEWVSGDVTLDGETVTDVGVRLRGKYGSFQPITQKPKWKFDFGEFVDGQRFQGLKHLALNNEVVDCSYLREPAGYAVFRQLDYPAPLTSLTTVTVNGSPYGVYVVVEFPDDLFLGQNYADPWGNLYDGKYALYDDGTYALADFTPAAEHVFELEEGVDVDRQDIHAISVALRQTGSFAELVEPLVDRERMLTYFYAEAWIGQIDGYYLNTNNYRVYFNPEDDRAQLIPWDLDYAFYPGYSFARPLGVLARGCWRDDDCHAAALDLAATTRIDSETLTAQIDAWAALIKDAVAEDPRTPCTLPVIAREQRALRAWVERRNDEMLTEWTP